MPKYYFQSVRCDLQVYQLLKWNVPLNCPTLNTYPSFFIIFTYLDGCLICLQVLVGKLVLESSFLRYILSNSCLDYVFPDLNTNRQAYLLRVVNKREFIICYKTMSLFVKSLVKKHLSKNVHLDFIVFPKQKFIFVVDFWHASYFFKLCKTFLLCLILDLWAWRSDYAIYIQYWEIHN